MPTPLYPIFKKRVDDAIEHLIRSQITPWSFLTAGPLFHVKAFDGREISYQGVKFDGSPRLVFWSRYIEPFLEHLCIQEINAAVSMAKNRGVDARLLLPELKGLLSTGFRKVYARMADVDRNLRGEGYPNKVEPRSAKQEIRIMDQFLDERIRAEIDMLFIPWWKRAFSKVAVIPLSTILALWGAGSIYKSTGAEELRTHIYQPLYAEIRSVEESVQVVSTEKPPPTAKLTELTKIGSFERIPHTIQSRLLKVSTEAQKIHSAVDVVNEILLREMSSRIAQIRDEETDRIWHGKTSLALRENFVSGKGISDSIRLSMNHAGRTRQMDFKDPNKPVISGPGGPSFVIEDWLTYPASVNNIEKLWTDLDYLYFNETNDAWYYQLTREDMKRINETLIEFLKPVHDALKQNSDFQFLLNHRPRVLNEVSELKTILADRIRDPKQLSDLFSG